MDTDALGALSPGAPSQGAPSLGTPSPGAASLGTPSPDTPAGRRVLILAGGDLHRDGGHAHLLQGPWEHIAAVDRGAAHAVELGLRPSVIIGDMDSIEPRHRLALASVPAIVHPADKDKTDTHLAVEWALAQGAREIVIAGGLGNRFDHSLANAQLLLALARRGARGVITDGRQALYLLDGRLELTAPPGFVLSILPLLPPCRGLTLRGLRWELTDYELAPGDTRTISNEFLDGPARLELREGAALVITGPPV